MITLFVEENNPMTPTFYNNLIASLQFHRLICPCGHSGSLSIHGYYYRSVKTAQGLLRFRICRVICSCCGHTHALLLSSMVPYSRISLADHVSIISGFENNTDCLEVMSRNPSIDESNLRFVIRQFRKHWKQRLISAGIILSDRLVLSCFERYLRQFMQIKNTENILFANTT